MKDPSQLHEVGVSVDFGIFKLHAKWEPDPRQRDAAWAMYVELATRIATQDLDLDVGLIREALDSLHALFPVTREILRREGSHVGKEPNTVGGMSITVLNACVRPFLAKWHPRLADWEARRDAQTSMLAHEKAWVDEAKCRGELAKLQRGLLSYAEALGKIAGAT
jgi:hypothetical protein